MANIQYTKTDAIITGTSQGDTISAVAFADRTGELDFTGGRNDTLFGLGGDDTLFAGDDQDRLFGGSGNDSLRGGRGNDTLFGGIGNDTLRGEDGDDVIAVEVNFPDVVGGEGFGTDTIIGGSGFDTVNFQTAIVTQQFLANPTVRIEEAEQGVSVNLVNSFVPGIVGAFSLIEEDDGSLFSFVSSDHGRIRDANGATLFADIERFTLTSRNDFFLDSSASHVIEGGAGNDVISGGGGFDIIDGGSGIDTALYGGSSVGVSISLLDFGNGGSGSFGDAEGDKLFGIENVHGSAHDDFMLGDANANELRGFDGNDTLIGGNGNDVVVGGDGNDTLRGGLGNDTVDGGEGSDTAQFTDWNGFTSSFLSPVSGKITLGEGSIAGSAVVSRVNFPPTIFPSSSEIERDTLKGVENVIASNFSESITGNSAVNKLEGRGGNDTLDGGRGSDVLLGGDGNDTAAFSTSSKFESVRVNASLEDGLATVTRSQSLFLGRFTTETDTLAEIENLTGNTGSDRLTGDALDNRLNGAGGNDVLEGLGGFDSLVGGDGVDTADYSRSSAGVSVNLANGTGAGGHASGDTLNSVENVTGSVHDDILTGSSVVNTLDGGAGFDVLSYSSALTGITMSLDGSLTATGDAAGDAVFNFEALFGSNHDDVLRGDGNANLIRGGNGNDVLSGGANNDVLDGGAGFDFADYSTEGAVNIDLESGTVGGAAAGDLFISIEAIHGGEGDNVFRGDAIGNTFVGLGGDDVLQGRGGDDTLNAGAGGDTIQGNDGNDTIDAGGGRDTVNAGSGDDTVNGGAGNDTITGGTGNDTLTGGLGFDTFIFTGNSGQDAITDFEDGLDTIRFNSGADSFADLAIAGNGTTDVTVIFGNNAIDITGAQAITLTAEDFLFL